MTINQIDLSKPVGIIAGNGSFPLACIKAAKKNGCKVFVCGHKDETNPELKNIADAFCWIRVGQLGKIIKFLKKHNCSQAIFIGGISRLQLFKSFLPDWTGLKVIKNAGSIRDDVILRATATELNRHNIHVFGADSLLTEFIVDEGVLTSNKLSEEDIIEAKTAWNVAKSIGSHDIGQTVTICQGLITSVECVEGTDEALLRAGNLAQGKYSIAVKVPKPQQDRRLDLPAIGLNTIETMNQAKIKALVLEDRGAMILEPQKVIDAANRHGIIIEVWKSI